MLYNTPQRFPERIFFRLELWYINFERSVGLLLLAFWISIRKSTKKCIRSTYRTFSNRAMKNLLEIIWRLILSGLNQQLFNLLLNLHQGVRPVTRLDNRAVPQNPRARGLQRFTLGDLFPGPQMASYATISGFYKKIMK